MQCTSFIPGCYSGRDLNAGANGGAWPLCNNDITLKSGHSYNTFSPPPTKDLFVVYDKEVLRQTMLKHESMFRDQVHELHRLYRRHRELMDEIRRALSKQNLRLQEPESNTFLSKISSESAQRTWQTPSLPWVNPAANRLSISSAENYKSTSSFFEWKCMQANPDPGQTEDTLKQCKLFQSKCEKPERKMLDLELPADEYIDSEEEDQFGEGKISEVPDVPYYQPKRMLEVLQNSDLKLFPCGGLVNSVCQGGFSSPDPFFRSTNDVADLNEPIRLEDAVASNSVDLLGCETNHKGIPCQDQELSGKSNSGFQVFSKEIVSSIQTRRAIEVCIKSVCVDGRQQELLPHNDEAGQSRSNLNPLPQVFSSGRLPMPSEQLKVELPAEFPMVNILDKCNMQLRNQRTNFRRETSERNHDLSYDDCPGLVSSYLPTSYQLVPESDGFKSKPSSVSSLRKPTHDSRQNPIGVQALPCFNIPVPFSNSTKSSVANPPLTGSKFHSSKSLRSGPGIGSVSPPGNSFCVGSKSEFRTEACSPLIGFNYLNCSSANGSPSEIHVNCFQRSTVMNMNSPTMDLNMPPLLDSEVSQINVGTEDGVQKIEDSRAVLPGPRAKSDYCDKPDKGREDISQTDLAFSQAFPTSVCNVKPKRFKTNGCPGSEKISTNQSFALASSSYSHPDASEDKDIKGNLKAGVAEINLASHPVFDSGKQHTTNDLSLDVVVNRKLSGIGNQIDLNSCIDEGESSSLILSIPRAIMKTMAEMDLEEAPVSPENKECSPPRGESEENHLETPIKLSKQEDRNPKDELVRMAAEAIVLISRPRCQKLLLETTVCEMLEASLADSLRWFAGVVSSVAGDPENEVGVLSSERNGDQQELSSDGSDYFEAMTLELTETNVIEYRFKKNGRKEEEIGAILSPSQPRRCWIRSRRQRKDFQAEVLPSLASLSRHEVTEDLQTIGGLMEAAGFAVETSLGRRNAGRNACSRARRQNNGRKNTICSLLKQQNNDSELAFGERSLKGWGKINKGRRGPRIPASNPRLIFS